jgi:hypothetical protein
MNDHFPSFGPCSTISDIDLDVEEVRLADGTRLTEARAEQIAAEALAEARRRNLIPGGKSLNGDGTHAPRVQFRVTDEIRDRAQRRADVEGISLSALARRALERYLAS